MMRGSLEVPSNVTTLAGLRTGERGVEHLAGVGLREDELERFVGERVLEVRQRGVEQRRALALELEVANDFDEARRAFAGGELFVERGLHAGIGVAGPRSSSASSASAAMAFVPSPRLASSMSAFVFSGASGRKSNARR